MLRGPVFNFELLSTARRARFYLVRSAYAALLLFVLWMIHATWVAETQGELASHLVKWFAFSAFCGIAIGQEVLVLALTPTLVAGSVADEKQRRTLHDLLSSRLTSVEIVIGKLMVRILYLAVLLAVSVPVMSLLVLLGGIDPRLVLLACGASISTAWFVAALSTLVSTIAPRPREALFAAFGLETLWLLTGPMLRSVTVPGWPAVENAAGWLAQWIGASSPAELARQWFYSFAGGAAIGAPLLESACWMIGLQLAFGLVLALLAAWLLRPVFRHQEGAAAGAPSRLHTARWLWHSRRYPVPDDRPMLWKELCTGRARGFVRFLGLALTALGGTFLAYYAIWYAALAIAECCEYGYTPTFAQDGTYAQTMLSQHATERYSFYLFLVAVVPFVYIVGILTVAGAASSAITTEHEEDTWASLTATDLSGKEIILAKQLGSLRRGRKFAAVIFLIITTGAAVGSLHALVIPAFIVALGVFGWFAVALGVWMSVHLRASWRAQFLTIGFLFLINVSGQLVLNTLADFRFAPQVWVGFTPVVIAELLFDPLFPQRLAAAQWPKSFQVSGMDGTLWWQAFFDVLSVATYGALALALTWHAIRYFPVAAGRARRQDHTPR
jgi:ABC-type transport system involved in multi-copper enzyme maturation permease subunit